MREGKRKATACLWMVRRQLNNAFCRMDYWIIIITLLAFFSVILTDTKGALAAGGEDISIFAVLPLLFSNRDVLLLIVIGYLFLVSDIPEFCPGIEMQILRVDRASWYISQWLYMAAVTVVYFIMIHIMAVLLLLPYVEISPEWGGGVIHGFVSGGDFPLVVDDRFLSHSALAGGLASLLLVTLLSFFFAGVCCICNLLPLHAGTGVVIDALFIFLYLLHAGGEVSLGWLSPMEMFAEYSGEAGFVFYGYASYYIALIIICIVVGFKKLSEAEIRLEI